jgi:hypothetical protein
LRDMGNGRFKACIRDDIANSAAAAPARIAA